ncbi:MAG: hypothetical protein EHM20_01500 [Alphaproteobacteria bacterium]|nr:MAG: hypothetical protein EHM20_01500 [Alphaproteobacteria bacterium]
MEKVLVFRDQKTIDTEKANIDNAVQLLQKVIDEAAAIEITISLGNLREAVSKPLPFVIKQRVAKIGDDVQIHGQRITNKEMFEGMTRPDVSKFIQAVSAYVSAPNAEPYLNISDGRVKVKTDVFENTVNTLSIYAEGDRQIKLWEAHKRLIDSINDFNEMVKPIGFITLDLRTSLKVYANIVEGGKLEPNLHQFVEMANRLQQNEEVEA